VTPSNVKDGVKETVRDPEMSAELNVIEVSVIEFGALVENAKSSFRIAVVLATELEIL
jgi:hypothetical protein